MSSLAERRHANFMAWMRASGLNSSQVAKTAKIPYTTVKSYEDKPTSSLKGDNEARIAAAYGLPIEHIFGAADPPAEMMEPNHIAAWRAKAGRTVEDVAAELKTSVDVIMQLEAGAIDLTPKWARKLAPFFGANPGQLSMSPEDASKDIVLAATAVPADQREQAVRVLNALKATGG